MRTNSAQRSSSSTHPHSAAGRAPACPPQVLGLSKDCSDRDVTRAYRKQVRASHLICAAREKNSSFPHLLLLLGYLGVQPVDDLSTKESVIAVLNKPSRLGRRGGLALTV